MSRAKMGDREKSADNKRHSNVSGEIADNKLFVHARIGSKGSNHTARYKLVNRYDPNNTEFQVFVCGKCGTYIKDA